MILAEIILIFQIYQTRLGNYSEKLVYMIVLEDEKLLYIFVILSICVQSNAVKKTGATSDRPENLGGYHCIKLYSDIACLLASHLGLATTAVCRRTILPHLNSRSIWPFLSTKYWLIFLFSFSHSRAISVVCFLFH